MSFSTNPQPSGPRNEGSSGFLRPPLQPPAVTRRYWTISEDQSLINAVKDLILEGWRSGNGWRGGFYDQCAMRINNQLPGANIRGKPHVNSRLAVWKRTYYLIAMLYGKSGEGVDLNQTIDNVIGTEIWEISIRTNPELEKLKGKQFPYYEDWKEMFGNDRATGGAAHDTGTTVQNLLNKRTVDNSNFPSQTGKEATPIRIPKMNEDESDAGSGTSKYPGSVDSNLESTKKRKVIAAETEDKLVSMMGSFMNKTEEVITVMANAIKSLNEVDPNVMKVFDALEQVTDLDMDQRVEVAQRIVTSQTHVALFFSMNPEGKSRFVRKILSRPE